MVRRILCAFMALSLLVVAMPGFAQVKPVVKSSQELDEAGNLSVTHTVKYKRRQFLQEGNHFYICKGKYLTYRDNLCASDSGVSSQSAERPLLVDIQERFGTNAKIVKAYVSQDMGLGRELVVLVSDASNALSQSALNDQNEIVKRYSTAEWVKINGEYYSCPDGKLIDRLDQKVCELNQGFFAYLGGREAYVKPSTLLDTLQKKWNFPVKILKTEEVGSSGLKVTFIRAEAYSDAIKDQKPIELIGSNRPSIFEDSGITWLADLLVATAIIAAISFMAIDVIQQRYRYSAPGLVLYVISTLLLNGLNFFVITVLAFANLVIFEKSKNEQERMEDLARRRAQAQQASVSAPNQARSLDTLRERQTQQSLNNQATPDRPTSVGEAQVSQRQSEPSESIETAPRKDAVRKIVLD